MKYCWLSCIVCVACGSENGEPGGGPGTYRETRRLSQDDAADITKVDNTFTITEVADGILLKDGNYTSPAIPADPDGAEYHYDSYRKTFGTCGEGILIRPCVFLFERLDVMPLTNGRVRITSCVRSHSYGSCTVAQPSDPRCSEAPESQFTADEIACEVPQLLEGVRVAR